MLFRRSVSGKYQGRGSGLMGFLRADSTIARLIIFAAMSAVFFFFLKITERKIPHGLSIDSTEQQVDSSQPATR